MQAGDKFRLALAYGSSLASFAADRGPRPISASFAVTDRCNLRCEYCNFPFLKSRDLKLPDIARLMDRLRVMGVVRLGIVGGEPMIRKDLARIISMAKERRFVVTVNTNLTLFGQFPRVLDEADHVFTSLDGDASTHEANRGQGALDGVFEAISALVARGKPVTAICVVRRGDSGMARRLLETARKLGITVHFQPQCVDAEIVRGELPPGVTNEELHRFWADLLAMKEAHLPVASSAGFLRTLMSWPDFAVSALFDPSQGCAAGRGFLFVDPEGNGSPCAYTRGKTRPINLLSDDWRTAWDGKTPCTDCSVGPMLEFNLLYRHPVQSAWNAFQTYAG